MPFRIFILLDSNLYTKIDDPPNLLKCQFNSNKLQLHVYFIYRQKPRRGIAKFAGYVKNCRLPAYHQLARLKFTGIYSPCHLTR